MNSNNNNNVCEELADIIGKRVTKLPYDKIPRIKDLYPNPPLDNVVISLLDFYGNVSYITLTHYLKWWKTREGVGSI